MVFTGKDEPNAVASTLIACTVHWTGIRNVKTTEWSFKIWHAQVGSAFDITERSKS